MPDKIRLQKFLAECGVASRRKAEDLIRKGKVSVNGELAQLGIKVDPTMDEVKVDGRLVSEKEKKVYLKIYKPVGYVSAVSDEKEQTVVDLVKDVLGRLYPVGRLDMGSEGLMILTNDGELANKLMHPRYEHEKEYEITVPEPLNQEQVSQIEEGVVLDGKKTLPVKIKPPDKRTFRIVLKEGRNRQIRRMLEAVGSRATRVCRVRIKNIFLGDLKPGEYRTLTPDELKGLLF
ncbi:MAG: rRNA pseudouridine synthase [Candidatus Saganbacteria bacterium]|nr:rRNA pseudouridine synthase [Candidatus Saganbacteria bacterium]